MCEASFHYLMHGSIVILIGQPFQFKAFVITFSGLSILENYHAGNNIRTGYIGNIKRLHPSGRLYGKHFSQQSQRRADPFFLSCDPLSLFEGIFTCQFHQTHIIPPLGYMKLWLSSVLLLQ